MYPIGIPARSMHDLVCLAIRSRWVRVPYFGLLRTPLHRCLNLQNDCYGVSTESGIDRVTILAISILAIRGDPVATALGTDLILKLRHYQNVIISFAAALEEMVKRNSLGTENKSESIHPPAG